MIDLKNAIDQVIVVRIYQAKSSHSLMARVNKRAIRLCFPKNTRESPGIKRKGVSM